MWVITFLAGPGFFLPVEQEVTRALAHRRAEGIGGGPVIVRAAQLGGILAAILVVVTLIFSPLIVEHLFDGYWLLLVGFLLGLVGYYAGHLGRGTFSGMGRFGAYGLYMGGEGVIRMALCVALAAVGVHTVGLYGLAVGIPPLIAVSIAVRREHNLIEPGPEAPFSEVSSNLGWLLAGSVLAAFMINAGPIAVTLARDAVRRSRSPASSPRARSSPACRCSSSKRCRRPCCRSSRCWSAPVASTDFRAGFRRLLTAVAGLGVAAVIGAFLIGPLVVRILFGPDYDLGRRNLTMLAASSALYMVAITTSQAIIALHGHARVAIGWLVGVITFVVVTAARQRPAAPRRDGPRRRFGDVGARAAGRRCCSRCCSEAPRRTRSRSSRRSRISRSSPDGQPRPSPASRALATAAAPSLHAQLGEQRRHVVPHGLVAQVQPPRDRVVGQPLRHEVEHLLLPLGQARQRSRRAPRSRRCWPSAGCGPRRRRRSRVLPAATDVIARMISSGSAFFEQVAPGTRTQGGRDRSRRRSSS